MSAKLKNLKDLLEHELQDLYSAENQLAEALPKMAKAAKNSKLKKAFEDHLKQTKTQIERLEKVAKDLDFKIEGEVCKGMKGLIKEGEDMIDQKAAEAVHDAGLIAAAQRIEHYEIAGYGTVLSYMKTLDLKDAAKTLAKSFDEEKQTDEKLSKLAEEINKEAMEKA
ncbi:MAG: ferritin-like domain-containing protein [Lentimicrobium sp.]|jgi:ferritin-like metal-binding protein YciE|nr:ferritin-like domain-containing protein [Lentimicrobium sp.]